MHYAGCKPGVKVRSLSHTIPLPSLLFTLSGTSPEPSLHSHPFLSTLGLHIPSPTLTHLNRTHGNLTPCIQVPVITSHTRQSSTCFSGHRIPASTRDGRPHLPSTPISPPSPPPPTPRPCTPFTHVRRGDEPRQGCYDAHKLPAVSPSVSPTG